MAARYIGQFFAAYTEQQYTVIVYDDEYEGSPDTISIAACEYNYPSGTPGRFDPILAAELSVKIVVTTEGLDTFVEDLAGAAEGRFMMQLAQGITPEFIGYVLPDLAQQEDTTLEVGYVLDLKATDGLARLKTIDYNNGGINYTGLATIADHILNCLNKLPGFAAFYTSAPILRTRVNWHSDQHTYTVGNEDPFDLTRIPHRAFYEIDSKGMFKYKSCFTVLTEICKSFGARMLYSEYAFWFVQYNEMATDANMKIFSYTLAGAQSNSTVNFRKTHDQTDDSSDLLRTAGGVFRFFPPLKNVQVDYRHIATLNLLAGQTAPFDDPPFNAGPVDFQNADGNMVISYNLRARIDPRLDPPGDVPIWLVFGILVQVGPNYLRRTATVSGGGVTYSGATWLNSPGFYQIAFLIPDGEYDHFFSDLFYTGSIIESGDFLFNIVLLSQHLFDGTEIVTAGGAGTVIWFADNMSAVHLYNGTLGQQSDIRRFRSTNNTSGNSAVVELITIIGDGIGTNSPGHLESYDGSDWVLSEGWRVGSSGSYIANSALLAQEIIRGQLTPVRRYIGEYNNRGSSIYRPHHVVKRADGIMMFAGGRFFPGRDAISGEWYFITPQSSGWTNEPFEDIQPDTGGGGSSPGGGGGGGDTTTPPVRIFQQEFTGSADDTVTVTANGGVLPGNPASIVVFFNGQQYNGYTVNGSDIEMNFTFTALDVILILFFVQ